MTPFQPECRAVLIGSLPLADHNEAVSLVLDESPDFPLWPQLPLHPKEGMVRQFLTGMPGLTDDDNRFWINNGQDDFETEMVSFYEEYMEAVADDDVLDSSRFALGMDTAPGFFSFADAIAKAPVKPLGVKGQITGPVSTGIGVVDHSGRNIIFDDNLRDMMVKLLSLKARWQVRRLQRLGCVEPPMIFIDEPGIVSFGSSAYIAITREMVMESLGEIVRAIHEAGGRAGIHICANGDFTLALESDADIISFDAYAYFDNITLYRQSFIDFIDRGGVLAWGIVPTLDPDAVDLESTDRLLAKWEDQLAALKNFGLTEEILLRQTLVASACGAGALTPDRARKVLSMTRELSERVRERKCL